MLSIMGRPRVHNERTADTLLDTAEEILDREGLSALSVRRIADSAETSTRAVYSLFGSKEALMTALGARAFDLLGAAVDRVPVTDDPAADLVAAGADAFRRF